MGLPNLTISKAETDRVMDVVQRAIELSPGLLPLQLAMDITAVVANGYPLDLEALLVSEELSFKIDVTAIMALLDRETGKLPEGIQLISRHREIVQ